MKVVNINFYLKRTDKASFFIPFHTHKCYELVYYFSGNGHCLIDGNRYEYDKNNFIIIPPNATHNDKHESECRLLCIGFTVDNDLGLPVGKLSDENRNIHNYLKIISTEFKNRDKDYVSIANNCMSNILIEIMRKVSIPASKSTSHQSVIEQALSYIDEYFLSDITAENLAEITNYSYHHFRHIFKNAFGMSPKQYIISKRIEHAKKLIATTSLSITEIGYHCGFPSTSLFIKQFRDNTNITPLQYRKQLQSDIVFSQEQSKYDVAE